jgi:hypothetical protein
MRHARFQTTDFQGAEADVVVTASGAITAGDFVRWVQADPNPFDTVIRADSDEVNTTPSFAGVAMTTAADGAKVTVRTVGFVEEANVATGVSGVITWTTTAGRAGAISWSLTGDAQTIALTQPIWGWTLDTAADNKAPVYLLRLPHGR